MCWAVNEISKMLSAPAMILQVAVAYEMKLVRVWKFVNTEKIE